jgi:aminodeoxyfutalosine deaminase
MIRKISAHYIYPIHTPPLKNGIVVIDNEGVIIDLIDTGGVLRESEKLEFYDGIITPGFINAHTHIELSHLQGKIPQQTGITGFIKNLEQVRMEGEILSSIKNAEKELLNNGVVAIGDIVNSSDTLQLKLQSKILSHSFVEIFAANPVNADLAISKGKILYTKFTQSGLKCSITPHAPYSVSTALWEKISNNQEENPAIWSIHNQESADENLLFINKTGKFQEILQNFNPSFHSWIAPGKTSLQFMMQYLHIPERILLVHNTFTSAEDLDALTPFRDKTYLVLCPKSNLYIENSLPQAVLFDSKGYTIAIGTDSLASNNNLSILEEMIILQEQCHIPFEKTINWATLNGARALGFESQIGSFEIGKSPGLNLISNFDFVAKKLTQKSLVKVIA